MVDTIRLDASWVRVVLDPRDGAQLELAVPVGEETGTWALNIYADDRADTAVLLSKPGTSVGTLTAPVIRFQLSAAEVDALMSAGKTRWRGYFEMYESVETAAWLRGDLIIAGGYEA